MNENSPLENPLEIADLYSPGLYVFKERKQYSFEYAGKYFKHVLHIFNYPNQKEHIHDSQKATMAKITRATKLNGSTLEPADIAIVNLGAIHSSYTLESVITEMNPSKVIIWCDEWYAQSKEILFYQQGEIEGFTALRCHSFETVIADTDRSKVMWAAMRRYFELTQNTDGSQNNSQ